MKGKNFMKRFAILLIALLAMSMLASCGDKKSGKEDSATLDDVKSSAVEVIQSTDLSNLSKDEKASVEKLIADYETKINEAKDADAIAALLDEYDKDLKKLAGGKATVDENAAEKVMAAVEKKEPGQGESDKTDGSDSSTNPGKASGSGSPGSPGGSNPSSGNSGSGGASGKPSAGDGSPSGSAAAQTGCKNHNRDGYHPGKEAVYETREVWDDHKSVEAFITCVFAPGAAVTIGPNNIPPGAIVEEYNDGGRRVDVYDPDLMAWIEERKAVYGKQWGSITWKWWQDDRWVGGYVTTEVEMSPKEEGYYYCTSCGKRRW